MLMAVDLIEYALVAEMSEVEGLEPQSLAEAKQVHDWLFWEEVIFKELKMLEGWHLGACGPSCWCEPSWVKVGVSGEK